MTKSGWAGGRMFHRKGRTVLCFHAKTFWLPTYTGNHLMDFFFWEEGWFLITFLPVQCHLNFLFGGARSSLSPC